MITLITGAPGAGKTALLVKLLMELSKGRPIFVDGIPDLKVDHAVLEDAKRWPELVPDGAAVVIDEVQRVWRPAGAGQKIPPDIAALETHRHRGLDFFIITQHPRLLHTNVRALVGRHILLRDIGVLGRWWYEWPECGDPDRWKSAPVKKKYKLDKKVFGQYRSASEHIKPIRSIPPVVIVLAVALVGVAVLGWMTYRAIAEKTEPKQAAVTVPVATGPASGRVVQAMPREAISGAHLVAMFQPRVSGRPETAPAYDELRKVVVMPRVVGGYCQGEVCRCYDNQNRRADISAAECAAWLKAPPFDPYRVPARPEEAQAARSGAISDAEIAAEL